MAQRPNILFLVLDTQRADRLSCYGYSAPTSPHLDAFAENAMLFQRAIAPAQWTIPSHASMFTGVYPSVHQTVQSYSVLPEELPTLAERLQAGGYFTAGFCNNPLVGVINNGLRRGFYSFLNYSGLMNAYPNQAGVSSKLLDRYRQGFKRFIAKWLNRIQDAFARSDALLALSFTPLMVPLWQTALSFKGNTVKSLADAAHLFIDRPDLKPEQPIFAFINLMGTHMPYHPPHRFMERFAPHVLRDREAQSYLRRFNGDVYGWLAPLSGALDDRQKAALDGMYDAEVACQDEQVGAFLQKLEQAGVLENTLVIICSDHGEHLGEKQFIGHSLTLYNELVQVPLLIRQPGKAVQGQKIAQAVSTCYLFHTVLDAAGLATPEEAQLSLLRREKKSNNGQQVFSEAVPPQNVLNLLLKRQPNLIRDRACDQPRRAVWVGSHKLIETGDQFLELYDVQEDPQESLNLSDILPENVEILQECLQVFAGQAAPLDDSLRAPGFDDPEVQQRLRDLGYLED
jgi:arylsulfatase A-like enzyme